MPIQMWHAMAALGVWPAASVVKLDDTAPGIGKARAAGTWAVGVALSGNIAGWSAEAIVSMPDDRKADARARAKEELTNAGAHLVIDSIADLPSAIAVIEASLRAEQGSD